MAVGAPVGTASLDTERACTPELTSPPKENVKPVGDGCRAGCWDNGAGEERVEGESKGGLDSGDSSSAGARNPVKLISLTEEKLEQEQTG